MRLRGCIGNSVALSETSIIMTALRSFQYNLVCDLILLCEFSHSSLSMRHAWYEMSGSDQYVF